MMARSRDSKKQIGKAALAAAVFFLCVFFATPLAGYVRAVKANVFAPKVADTELSALSKDALIARVRADEETLEKVRYQAVLYGLLVKENEKLRIVAHAAGSEAAVTARILSRPPQSMYDTLLLDEGSADGVAEGDPISFEGIALGRIVSVDAHTSVARLFSSPGTESDVVVGTPPAIVIAKGQGGGAFELSIPQGITVAAGDSVRMSAPHSVLLGVVAGVSAKPTDASQTVYVHVPVSLAELDFVTIAVSSI